MNIDEYRAHKAQLEVEQATVQGGSADAQVDQGTTATPVQTQTETTETGGASSEQGIEATAQIVEVDGAQVPIDELKNGYLRQSDYTKKTQELAQQKAQLEIADQYYKALQSDPEEAKLFAERNNLPFLSPQEQELQQIKQQYDELLVRQEVELMQLKFKDFNDKEVVKFAIDNQMNNLEDAYLLMKAKTGGELPSDNINTIKDQIRQEILQELQLNQSPSSIIGQKGQAQPIVDNTPVLSDAERKVARGLRMTDQEYASWRDAK